jgi:hypothetical protein
MLLAKVIGNVWSTKKKDEEVKGTNRGTKGAGRTGEKGTDSKKKSSSAKMDKKPTERVSDTSMHQKSGPGGSKAASAPVKKDSPKTAPPKSDRKPKKEAPKKTSSKKSSPKKPAPKKAAPKKKETKKDKDWYNSAVRRGFGG